MEGGMGGRMGGRRNGDEGREGRMDGGGGMRERKEKDTMDISNEQDHFMQLAPS